MSQSDVDTIRGAYEAFSRGDIPAVLEAFDPEIDWNTPESLPYGGHFRGHEEVTGFFQGIPEHIDDLRVEPAEFLDAGDHVVVTGELTGRGKSGAQFTAAFAMVWRMRDGKAVEFREYTDSAPVVEATAKQTA
jgi:uncharacterized protein